jgi:hypothetical protein
VFRHPDCEAASIEFDISEHGADAVLVILTPLSISPEATGYDFERVHSLKLAARRFTHANGIRRIRLVSARSPEAINRGNNPSIRNFAIWVAVTVLLVVLFSVFQHETQQATGSLLNSNPFVRP